MKKTYIAPSIRVREVELTNIIATSMGLNQKMGRSALSRESGWDDEDDDF